VEISFRTRKLERAYTDHKTGEKAFGREVARRYIQRVNLIKQARDIDELLALPAIRCHVLKGARQGQYAMTLTGFYRLIFSLEGGRLEIARIEEVSKHYGD
jgi:proteic killer suppression protein